MLLHSLQFPDTYYNAAICPITSVQVGLNFGFNSFGINVAVPSNWLAVKVYVTPLVPRCSPDSSILRIIQPRRINICTRHGEPTFFPLR